MLQTSDCLDELTLGDFLAGGLSRDLLAHVEAHLDACLDCSTVVSVLAGGAALGDSASTSASTTSLAFAGDSSKLAAGTRVGRYVVADVIGEGAMGTVYLARDPDLSRLVALKIVRAAFAFDTATRALIRERMQREAQTMARLAHPNVVTVFDVGRLSDDDSDGDSDGDGDGDGDLWIAMERVDGQSLRAHLAASKGSRAQNRHADVVALLLQAARGLAAAHAAGIVHRDFKPDNVLVGRDGRVRVTDFGVARAETHTHESIASSSSSSGGAVTDDVALTQTGALVGTPVYMAPELLLAAGGGGGGGGGSSATFASDQFSFAVTAYEALLGERPFAGKTIAELLASARRGPSFSTMDGGGGGAKNLSRRTRVVLARALSFDPQARFASMNDLVRVLEPPSASSQWRMVMGVAGALALATVVAFASRSQQHGIGPPTADACAGGAERATAMLSSDDASAKIRASFGASGVANAAAIADRVIASLRAYADGWSRVHRTTCEATHVKHEQSPALLDARMECLNRQLSDARAMRESLEAHANPEAVNASLGSLASLARPEDCATASDLTARDPRPQAPDAHMRLDEIDLGMTNLRGRSALGQSPLFDEASALIVRADALAYRPAQAEAHLLRATIARRESRFAEGDRDALQAVLLAEAARDDRVAALGWIELAATSAEQKRAAVTLERTDHALAAIARIGTPKDLEASALFLRGIAHTHRGDMDDADRDLHAALERRRALYGERHLEITRTMSSVANVLRLRGNLDAALAMHREALAIDEALLGSADHASTARHHHNIGGVLRLQGDLDKALSEYQRARAIEVTAHGEKHRSVGQTENSLGLVYLAKGQAADLREARMHFENARVIFHDHPEEALALENLGLVAAAMGAHAEAITFYEQAQSRAASDQTEAALGPERTASILANQSRSEQALHRNRESATHAQAAKALATKHAKDNAEAAAILRDLEATSGTSSPTPPTSKSKSNSKSAPPITTTVAPIAPHPSVASPPKPSAPSPTIAHPTPSSSAKPRGGAYTSVESTDTER